MNTNNAFPLLVSLSVGLLLTAAPSAPAQTQTQLNQSAGQEAARADAALNTAYRRLLAVLDSSQKTQLRQSQRLWLKFRDAEAALLSSKVKGGSLYPMAYADHRRAITEQRTRELKDARTLFTTEGAM